MKLFNVEFFDTSFDYVGSHEIGDFSFEYDYLSLSNNEIMVLESTGCEIGNIIHIKSLIDNEEYIGIVTAITIEKGSKKVKFKSFLEMLNIKVMYSVPDKIEKWIADKLKSAYVDSEVEFQNMPISTYILTETEGTLESDNLYVNLYEMIEIALRKYQITVNFSLDMKNKKIICKIGKISNSKLVIEADLPNVINSNISVKTTAESSVNKLTIINSEDNTMISYVRHTDGTIDTDIENDRIIPVIFDYTTIKCTADEFPDKAKEQAETTLSQDKLDNLIEITVTENDTLVDPETYEIGQEVEVIHNGQIFNSILTGIKYSKGQKTLVFGAIRLELTKILKRRLKNGN